MTRTDSSVSRITKYVILIVVFSTTYNIPKFLETELVGLRKLMMHLLGVLYVNTALHLVWLSGSSLTWVLCNYNILQVRIMINHWWVDTTSWIITAIKVVEWENLGTTSPQRNGTFYRQNMKHKAVRFALQLCSIFLSNLCPLEVEYEITEPEANNTVNVTYVTYSLTQLRNDPDYILWVILSPSFILVCLNAARYITIGVYCKAIQDSLLMVTLQLLCQLESPACDISISRGSSLLF